MPKDFRYFDNLISDNIDYITINKQMNKDKSLYRPVNIQSPSMSVIIQKKQTHTELVQYLHTACFPPVKSTFEKAIKQHHFKTWLGLTADILKHLHMTVYTVQGHMHQE